MLTYSIEYSLISNGTVSGGHATLRYEYEKYKDLKVSPSMWSQIYSLDDHVALYAFHEIHRYIEWVNDGEYISWDNIFSMNMTSCDIIPENAEYNLIRECVNRLKSCDLEAFFVDITTDDINASGFKVVRVCIPGTIPLHSIHKDRPLWCGRFYNVPSKIGYSCPSTPNEVPHPYP